jgi:hypothetical protein
MGGNYDIFQGKPFRNGHVVSFVTEPDGTRRLYGDIDRTSLEEWKNRK